MLVRNVCIVLVWSCLLSRAEIASGPGKDGGGGGWLDRVVLYFKNKLVADVDRAQKVKIDVALEQAPAGYVDSPAWDEASVLRLLSLVRRTEAEDARPVRRAIRRALRPVLTRRLYYTPQDSRIMFPSLKKSDANNFYYSDTASEEERHSVEYEDSYEADNANDAEAERRKKRREEWEASRKNVVVVRNPVEARLPSSRISIELLRKIMEERAAAARVAPSSTRVTRTWLPRHNSTAKKTTKATKHTDVTDPGDGGNATTAEGGAATTAPPGEGETTAGGATGGGGGEGADTTTPEPEPAPEE